MQLATTAARDTFVSSVSAIIDRYGLDGLDIDFEGHSLSLNPGDTDFRNPTTPVIVNLISALRTLKQRYGVGFVLTMAPETFFVQLGYQYYGSGPFGGQDPRAGAYLPVIYALRDDLTVLHVQDYNSGPIMGLDNQYHTMGGADFHIAMTDMLLTGFPVAGNPAACSPRCAQDQVAFGTAGRGQRGQRLHRAGRRAAGGRPAWSSGTYCGGYTPRSGTNPALPRPDDLVDQLGPLLRLGIRPTTTSPSSTPCPDSTGGESFVDGHRPASGDRPRRERHFVAGEGQAYRHAELLVEGERTGARVGGESGHGVTAFERAAEGLL